MSLEGGAPRSSPVDCIELAKNADIQARFPQGSNPLSAGRFRITAMRLAAT